jgi:hypothetical protein
MESSASLEGAPVSQYHRRLGFEAQPLTMKRCAALFHGQPRSERGALSVLTMAWGDAGCGGQRLHLIEYMAQMYFQKL